MNALFNLFTPAPHLPEIQDKEVVKSDYRYWRVRIIYSMFIGYAFYYFTRKSFTFAMPGLIEDLHFDKGQLGLLGSILYITYALSKFASGVLSDKSSPRFFMAFGLIMTGIINICFGLSSSFWLFAIFWGLNGWFQGFGWPPCARFLTSWYSQNERGAWWSTWSASHNVGSFLIPWVIGACIYFFDSWRVAMYVPGVMCILGGFFLINRLRDTPQSIGLPSIEQFRDDYGGISKKDLEQKNVSVKEILVDYVLKNKYIWLLALAYFFVYVVRTGIGDWTALFLIEQKGYSRLGASGSVSLFEVGGFCGTLSSGWISDKLFAAKRGPVNILCSIGMMVTVALFWLVPQGYPVLDSCAIFSIGYMTFGPQVLIGVAAAELAHKRAVSTSTGFAGCFAYMGAAMAGYPLGVMTQELGWNGFFLTLVLCCGVAALLLSPMWSVRANVTESKPEPTADKEEKDVSYA